MGATIGVRCSARMTWVQCPRLLLTFFRAHGWFTATPLQLINVEWSIGTVWKRKGVTWVGDSRGRYKIARIWRRESGTERDRRAGWAGV